MIDVDNDKVSKVRESLTHAYGASKQICRDRSNFKFSRHIAEMSLEIGKLSMLLLIAVAAILSMVVSNIDSISSVIDKAVLKNCLELLFRSGSFGLVCRVVLLFVSIQKKNMDLLLSVDNSDRDKFIQPILTLARELSIELESHEQAVYDLKCKNGKFNWNLLFSYCLLISCGLLFASQISLFYRAVTMMVNGVNL